MLEKLKPWVPRRVLLAVAGFVWTVVGAMLCVSAFRWLSDADLALALPLGALAVVLAIVVAGPGFTRIARKNIGRIESAPDRACVFGFQAWKSYLLVGFMIALGTFLRHSPIPKEYLAVVYATIGGALLVASLPYYVSFRRLSAGRRFWVWTPEGCRRRSATDRRERICYAR